MKCTRLYTDAVGNSQFDEIDIPVQQASFGPPAAPIDLSEPQAATRVIFASIAPGWVGVRHTAPHRQYFVQMTESSRWKSPKGGGCAPVPES